MYQLTFSPEQVVSIKTHTIMINNKRIQKGAPLEKITISQGPSKFELMLSVFNGKKIPIALKEANDEYPHNLFDAYFYSAGSSDISNHYLNYQCTHTDNGKGLLSNEDVPWLVKVAIMPRLHPASCDDMVHYEGTYDAIKREGALTLITKKEAVIA